MPANQSLPKTSLTHIALSISIAIFIAGLLYISCYNHPNTDDYGLGYNFREHGFWGYQVHIYKHWGGRYFSNIMGALFASNGFLFSHYYFHTFLLVFATIGSIYFFLLAINQYWLEHYFSKIPIAFASCILTIVFITCNPETSTAFFWFSSSITYQLSAVLLFTSFGLALKVLNEKKVVHRWLYAALLLLNIIAINGSNEVAALSLGMILLALLTTHKKHDKTLYSIAITAAIIYLITIAIAAFAPGNTERLQGFENKNYIAVVAVTFARIGYLFWNIFQSPVFWIVAVGAYVLGLKTATKIVVLKRGKSFRTNLILSINILAIALLIVHLPILFISNGSLPERATNLFVLITATALLMIAFYCGLQNENKAIVAASNHATTQKVVVLALMVSIVCNGTSKEIFKSIMAAKLFSAVMNERELVLKNSPHQVVSLPTYDSSVKKNYPLLYGEKQKAIVQQWILQKPSLLFVFDDLENNLSIKELQHYYQTDSIKVVP